MLDHVLDERELESLRFGYRERVTDTHLPHISELPQVLPGIFADAAGRAREAGCGWVEAAGWTFEEQDRALGDALAESELRWIARVTREPYFMLVAEPVAAPERLFVCRASRSSCPSANGSTPSTAARALSSSGTS